MINDFSTDWKFSDNNINLVKDILQENAMYIVKVEVATPDQDMKECTDLKVVVTSGDIAVRIRRSSIKFRDLTIRAFKNGNRTEIHKLRDGYGDFYLYAWLGSNGIFDDWILADINIMRDAGLFSEDRFITMNTDGRTGFISYELSELAAIGALLAWRDK